MKSQLNCYAQHTFICLISFHVYSFSQNTWDFYELSLESFTTWIHDQCLSFTIQESLFASVIFTTSQILPFLVAATDFSHVGWVISVSIFVDQLKCSEVSVVEPYFLQRQLYFLQFKANPSFSIHNKATSKTLTKVKVCYAVACIQLSEHF